MHHRRSATAVCDHPPGHGPQVHDAEQGDPDGETILFLPAFGDSWFSTTGIQKIGRADPLAENAAPISAWGACQPAILGARP